MRTPGRRLLLLLALTATCAAAQPEPAASPALEAAGLFKQGRFAAAAELFTTALEQFGADGPAGGRLHFDLGACRLRLGQLADAEYHMRRAVLQLDEAAGPGSAEASAAREGLATVLIAQGNMLEAEEVLDAALAARTALFGAGHPQVLRTLDLMASVHWLDGQPRQALDLYLQVMAGLRAIHGNVHPLTATTARIIGAVQLEIRSDWTAEIMFRQAVYIVEALHGAGHADLVAPLCGLGDIFTRAGLPEQALGYYERALAAVDANSTSFATSGVRVRALEGVGRLRIATGDPAAALDVLQEAVTRHDQVRARAGGDMEAATIGGSPRPCWPMRCCWRVGRTRPGGCSKAAVAGSGPPGAQPGATACGSACSNWKRAPMPSSIRLSGGDCSSSGTIATSAALTAAQAAAGARTDLDPAVVRAGLAPGDLLLGWLDATVAGGQRATWVYVMTAGDGLRWFRLADTPWRRTPAPAAGLPGCPDRLRPLGRGLDRPGRHGVELSGWPRRPRPSRPPDACSW